MLIFRENPEKFLCSLSPEMSLLSEFQNFNRQHRLFEKKSKILLAVSGGMDSVAMVELFHQAEISFGIAHCNFNLRGKESEDDQAFVRALSKKYKVPFFTKKFNTKKIANQGQLSIQEAARNLRYNWFEEIRKEKSFDKIATAHQLDDSIETFFINLLRGTGIKGLIGIPTKTGKIIRPLNFCSRAQIFAFVKANEIDWREDSSNETDNYLRNRIRHHLLPVLEELQPAFQNKMSDNFRHLTLASGAYDELIHSMREKFLVRKGNDRVEISIASLAKQKDPGQVLSALLHSQGITNLNSDGILHASSTGKIFDAGNHRILVNRGKLLLEKKKEIPEESLIVTREMKCVQFHKQSISLIMNNIDKEAPFSKKNEIQVLDADKIEFPLVLRPWKSGDFFYPLGMKHRKKLSDYFTDKKISRFDKEKFLVCLSAGNIVCILGLGIDERFKVRNSTKKVLQVKSTFD